MSTNSQQARIATDQRGASKLIMLLTAVIVLVIIAGGVTFALTSNKSTSSDKSVNTNEFQALFLTNGQVYFGKLSNLDGKYVTLSDIFYLQVQQNSSQSLQQASNSTTDNSKVSLAKLGNELHGPEDKMQVASSQVLFWENLKPNSKVVQAIDKYQNQ